jgi:hypothetical protein
LQIKSNGNGIGECTLGFNAYRNGVQGFVTASHCTTTMGVVDGIETYQPQSGLFGVNKIGQETVDPSFYPCVSLGISYTRCRTSDSAFFQYNYSISPSSFQKIHTTAYWAWYPMLISNILPYEINGSRNVVGTGTVSVGENIGKVGRTTGGTIGAVLNTCQESLIYPNYFPCQTIVQAGAAPGDSGAPVFKFYGADALAVGLLTAGPILTNGDYTSQNNPGHWYSFAPIQNVINELGITL